MKDSFCRFESKEFKLIYCVKFPFSKTICSLELDISKNGSEEGKVRE